MVLMVREIKEIRRAMTVEEMCMWYVSRGCDYTDSFLNIAKTTLDVAGFCEFDCRYDEVKDGVVYLGAAFRQVIERPATHTEIVSYHLLQALGDVECCTATGAECGECPLKGLIHDYDEIRQECRANIKDLEFFEKED